MPFWRTETLKDRIQEHNLIDPYDPQRVKCCAYELSVGSQAYITSNPGDKVKLKEDDKIVIPPGQFGLVITKEKVTVPNNAIAFISIRATIKFQGLINVSGFHVDPGYSQPLKFAVYNAGSQTIILDQGQAVFLIWYADLDTATQDTYKARPGSGDGITSDDVRRLYGEVASPAELKALFDDLRNEVDKKFHELDLKTQFIKWMVGVGVTLLIGLLSWVVFRPMLSNTGKIDSALPSQEAAPVPSGRK
jgi:dCTP deaminase